jgi:hypothetical protein
VEPQAIEHLRRLCVAKGGDLRPCYPRDFIAIMESIALFEEREPAFTAGDIDRAGALYFAVV